MKYTRISNTWNADPNAPEVKCSTQANTVTLEFYLNYFLYDDIQEGDRAKLSFINCHKYSFNTMNDEGYFLGQYRYKNEDLPWGGFYRIDSKWEADFPSSPTILLPVSQHTAKNHCIFFFKDNTFECVAEKFEIEFYKS